MNFGRIMLQFLIRSLVGGVDFALHLLLGKNFGNNKGYMKRNDVKHSVFNNVSTSICNKESVLHEYNEFLQHIPLALSLGRRCMGITPKTFLFFVATSNTFFSVLIS